MLLIDRLVKDFGPVLRRACGVSCARGARHSVQRRWSIESWRCWRSGDWTTRRLSASPWGGERQNGTPSCGGRIYGDRKAERRAEAELLDEVYAAVGRACCTRSSPNIWRPSCSSRAWPKQQLPGHFEEELRVYLKCGILAHGFVRLRCADCESPRDVTSTGAPLPPPPGPSLLFFRGIEVQTLECIRGS
jgi:hypothetical protein